MEQEIPLPDKLNLETARISWPELERFFARGRVLHISNTLDLIEVAQALAEDDTEKFANWTQTQAVEHLSDQSAKQWVKDDSRLWAVVVAPWVLVQEK